jgi:uncharacterized phage infection (PIP) family protein YhgE
MTTEINAAQAAQLGRANNSPAELSEETLRKLQEFGISAAANMTEAEAEEIIQEMEDEQKEPEKIYNTLGEKEINNDIKNLASAVGLRCEANEEPEEILVAIAEEIEAQIDDAENNPQALSTLMGYYNKLSVLDAQLEGIHSGAKKLFSAMDVMANKNREEFGF